MASATSMKPGRTCRSPLLGARLQECAEVLAGLDERLLGKYFAGQPDELTVAQLQRGRA